MQYARTGIILCTERYEQCVDFYCRIMGLPMMHSLDNEHSKLSCCDMGNGNYLMIETGGTVVADGKSIDQNPTCLRFNVQSVETVAAGLMEMGIDVTIRVETWGIVADFLDPDGNRCSLREEGTFSP